MENATLETAAKILEVSEESLQKFPEDIKASMTATLEMIEPDTKEECKILHDSLAKLWEQGNVYIDMKEVSEETGADFATLMSLDYQSQMNIAFEYAIDVYEGNKNAVKNVYENIRQAQEIIELPLVAELLNVDYDDLRKYPREVWVQLCGAYSMLYDESGDNSELISELENIIKNVEEKENV